ncbi:hypothetical protein M431DRAFT_9653 [Trichoderma harzianum CBS 226.95]|uniref:Helicase ATP-binding domain-containing protein n=1 Tax=Trichoderma harzianum CBS 226.95 TaxID=983964 RepID=A0A2T3ZYE7_TRIHA|nr:hypothetical protein M431DRAFT_9653 [Trichoderma harzianum CBS 226.95]PTB49798.1 hypothetical protein M431DRAFT_9653 [Trichoderma harzianum CBS 226.95]
MPTDRRANGVRAETSFGGDGRGGRGGRGGGGGGRRGRLGGCGGEGGGGRRKKEYSSDNMPSICSRFFDLTTDNVTVGKIAVPGGRGPGGTLSRKQKRMLARFGPSARIFRSRAPEHQPQQQKQQVKTLGSAIAQVLAQAETEAQPQPQPQPQAEPQAQAQEQAQEQAYQWTYQQKAEEGEESEDIGSTPVREQLSLLSRGCNILIGTPGRLKDFIGSPDRRTLRRVKYMIIDEAHEMLNQDWEEELRAILSSGKQDEGNVKYNLFSATFPRAARALAKEYPSASDARFRVGRAGSTTENIKQIVIETGRENWP